ncbi:MAG: asparaginase domain-containing protein [Bdellovibrionales bacterium]
MTIFVITTGGTIGALPYQDPIFPPRECTIPADGTDIVREVVQTVFQEKKTLCVSLGLRDSYSVDEPYRHSLVELIRHAPQDKILITHGTDSMVQTADFLYDKAQKDPTIAAKKIILTGAMIPLSNGSHSDGYQNLAFALSALENGDENLNGIHLVLCDFDGGGYWCPRLYTFTPGKYEKVYATDGRYNRLYERA